MFTPLSPEAVAPAITEELSATWYRELIASDWYWQELGYPYPEATYNTDKLWADMTIGINNKSRVARDIEAGKKIANIVNLIDQTSTIKPIARGDELPIPHDRQVIRVVEDSRKVKMKHRPIDIYVDRSREKNAKRLKELLNIDVPNPTYEDNLKYFHDGSLFPPRAQGNVEYSKTRLASVARRVLYLCYDERSDSFVALPSYRASYEFSTPKQWRQERCIELIPQENIGTPYRKNGEKYLGKIIEAQVLELSSVQWKNNKPKKPPQKRKPLLAKPVVAGLSMGLS